MRSFQEILEFEKRDPTPSTLEHFCDELVKIRNRHSNVVETMAQGVLELKESHDVDCHTEHSIQYFLDRFYMSRISIRMLINQHSKLTRNHTHSCTLFFSQTKKRVQISLTFKKSIYLQH